MSVVVRPAEEGDIESVVDLLFDNMSQKVSKERWRRLLDYPWRPADADRGHIAVDGDRAVGFLGLVYADRPIGGRVERFCNICAWYLLKNYRGQGIGQRIQFGSVADPGMTYTIMTATLATGRAFGSNSGFQVLDDTRYLLRRRAGSRGDIECIDEPDRIDALLGETLLGRGDRQIFLDHRPYNLRHLLVRAGDDACYIAMQAKRKGEDIDYHEVMYASDGRLLGQFAPAIADAILGSDSAVFAIDRRFLPVAPEWECETIRLPRWYRSPRVAPARIDHLYGEIALLDLKLP
jgi:GNAT superfamily N-acetyltransferase